MTWNLNKLYFLLATLAIPLLAQAEVTLTFGGDMNFNASRVATRANGTTKGGKNFAFPDLFQGIAPHLDGELNFANLETVVSDCQDLPGSGGTFVFASHSNSLDAAVNAGINLFNLANNHIGDHGLLGMQESLKNMDRIARQYGVHYSGLGYDRDSALTPAVFDLNTPSGTYRIALLGITAVSNAFAQAGPSRPGTLYLRHPRDLADAMATMAATRADYKILSVHGGTEGSVLLDPSQRDTFRNALEQGDIDLILGHHPHRVRSVERIGHKLIFYSLGNYLMLGAANINGLPEIESFGLLGKLHLEWSRERQRLVAQAAEAIPLVDTHVVPRPYPPAQASRRIEALNSLGRSQLGDNAVLFRVDSLGLGSSCLGQEPGPKAQRICSDWAIYLAKPSPTR